MLKLPHGSIQEVINGIVKPRDVTSWFNEFGKKLQKRKKIVEIETKQGSSE